MKSASLGPRLAARLLDLTLVLLAHRLVELLAEPMWPAILSYFGYVGLVALLGGKSLGKALWQLEVIGPKRRSADWWRLLGRELGLLVLGPLVLLGRREGRLLTDRLFQTQVIYG